MRNSTVICFLFEFSFCFLILSCHKEAVETETQAAFNMPASAGNCSDIIIPGSFLAGTALSNADSIKIKVDVSKAGTWNYKSDTINGISFSGAGTLIDTGWQYIVLNGSGTPVLPGNIAYSFGSGVSVLKYYITVLEKDIESETVPATTPYFKITIDNIEYTTIAANADPSQQVGMWSLSATGDSISVGCGIGPDIYPNPPGTGTISLQKNFLDNNTEAAEPGFKNFFQHGAYPFAIGSCQNVTRGIIIFWSDSDGQTWSTHYGADQEGSFFKIVGTDDGYNSNGKYYVKVKMKFKCKLYLHPTGQMKELTNGEMVAYFVKYE